MCVQLINFLVLVAIINGVYSNTLTKKGFPIALVTNVVSVKNNLSSFFIGFLYYNSSSQEVKVKLHSEEESELPPDASDSIYYENIILLSGQELTYFNGKLYAADKETGRLYLYKEGKFEWWMNVPRKPNTGSPVMPISWATALRDFLYVGPNGNNKINYIAVVSEDKVVKYIDFTEQIIDLKNAAGVANGNMTLESCVYSEIHNEFYFLPKIASRRGDYSRNAANILLTMDKDMTSFNKVAEIQHSTEHKDRGYSSFTFVPGTKDEVIVALQTSYITNSTYITAFTRQGKVVLDSMEICDGQVKGLAFL